MSDKKSDIVSSYIQEVKNQYVGPGSGNIFNPTNTGLDNLRAAANARGPRRMQGPIIPRRRFENFFQRKRGVNNALDSQIPANQRAEGLGNKGQARTDRRPIDEQNKSQQVSQS